MKHMLQIQQYNDNKDKVEFAPYNKALQLQANAMSFNRQQYQ